MAAASPASQPIITPEAVVLDFERAGAASRTIAIALDALALAATLLVILIAGVLILGDSADGGGAALVALVGSLGAIIVWFCAFETLWRGRTPGKAVMGLRVISADGTTVRFQQAFLRAAMMLVDFFLIPIGFVAVVAVLLSPRDQRLGDMAAGTLVVRERSASTFVAPAWFVPPPGWEGYARSLDVTALDEETYGLIRSYLLRVHELSGGARDHLAVRLANPVALKIGHHPPAYVHPHLFLTCVAATWQRTHGWNPYDQPLDPRAAPRPAAPAGPTSWPAAPVAQPTPTAAPMYAPPRTTDTRPPPPTPPRPLPPPPPVQDAPAPPTPPVQDAPAPPTPPVHHRTEHLQN